MVVCRHCNKEHNRKSAFCSKQCKNAYWYIKNKEHKKQYFNDNNEHIKQREKAYRIKNKEQCNQRCREYYREHDEEIKAEKSIYRKQNRDKINKYNVEYYKDINNKLRKNLRGRLSCAISRNFNGSKGGSFVKDLGCSMKEFKDFIAGKFQPDMSWDNYGWGNDKWHLDHIVPLIKFDLTDLTQFKIAANYTNYQPLWQLDNFRKGGR